MEYFIGYLQGRQNGLICPQFVLKLRLKGKKSMTEGVAKESTRAIAVIKFTHGLAQLDVILTQLIGWFASFCDEGPKHGCGQNVATVGGMVWGR